jgi:hypothetical protein
MDELTLNPKFLQNLILRTRALKAEDGATSDDEGNYVDDKDPAVPRYDVADYTAAELTGEIEDLEPDQQAELVALMWIGRGDMEPGEWEAALQLAMERREGPTSAYLLANPLLAEHWDEGLDRLLDGSDLVETGEY